MYCRKCGFEIPDDSVFCVKCGTPVEGAAAQPQRPEPVEVHFEEKIPAAPTPVKKKKKTGLILACAAVALALVGACLFFFVFGGSALPAVGKKQVSILEDKDKLAEISASVLKIECYDITGEVYATGSGFVAFDPAFIVTNYHVIEDGPYTIKALTESGGSYEIDKIIAYNEEMDIAVLKTEAGTGLAPLPFAEKPAEKTDKVVAIGSPLGLVNIVSEGIVSGFTQVGNESVIQFTASISHGSSGGVLLNEAGEVVGVTFASYSEGQNLNMAIPVLYVDALYRQASPAKAVTVKQFFDTVEHVYPVSYVFENFDEFTGKTVTIESYITYIYNYDESGNSSHSAYVLALLADSNISTKGYSLCDALSACQKGYFALMMMPYDDAFSAYRTLRPGDYYTASGKIVFIENGDDVGFSLYNSLRLSGLSDDEITGPYKECLTLPIFVCD